MTIKQILESNDNELSVIVERDDVRDLFYSLVGEGVSDEKCSFLLSDTFEFLVEDEFLFFPVDCSFAELDFVSKKTGFVAMTKATPYKG